MSLDQKPASEVEITGECVIATVEGLGAFEEIARRILARNGIEDPQPGKWYSFQSLLNALTRFSDRSGPTTMHRIGVRLAYKAQWPSIQVISIERTLRAIDTALYMNVRGGDIGHIELTEYNEGKAVLESTLTMPCAIDRGVIEGSLERFCPHSVQPKVVPESTDQKPNNGNHCSTYLIEW